MAGGRRFLLPSDRHLDSEDRTFARTGMDLYNIRDGIVIIPKDTTVPPGTVI